MTTLTFLCPLICDKTILRPKPEEPFRLRLVADEEFAEEEWTVEAIEIVKREWIWPRSIFRAQIKRPDDPPLDVVFKMDFWGSRREELIHEANVYQGVGRELCADVLPAFYGCFQTEINSTIVTCLVLEDCGEPMMKPLDEMNGHFQSELLKAVHAIHKKGLEHGDIYPCNILVVDGHPVLIDLKFSKPHECGLRMKLVCGTLTPTEEEYGCNEL
ncbi:hypothetical protein FB45DRAFT_1006094 [Roridomyces roridus]|uniref:Protein kinase domain-containing protein n=1 Tax=Roridomyces roridus TaxID=1738132 RepID=A0AAD7BKZ8_9AGAR|nr:hypothetical protein FB45DRAFT_1006094 [Roridomyces roridus]